jgi:hypothetical protein
VSSCVPGVKMREGKKEGRKEGRKEMKEGRK